MSDYFIWFKSLFRYRMCDVFYRHKINVSIDLNVFKIQYVKVVWDVLRTMADVNRQRWIRFPFELWELSPVGGGFLLKWTHIEDWHANVILSLNYSGKCVNVWFFSWILCVCQIHKPEKIMFKKLQMMIRLRFSGGERVSPQSHSHMTNKQDNFDPG